MIDELTNNPSAFDFFAAVRLLERIAQGDGAPQSVERERNRTATSRRKPSASGRREPVGGDNDPRQEAVRFTAHSSLTFPVGDVDQVELGTARDDGGPPQPVMSVNFLGLVGTNGALPQHYTSLILSRLRERDSAFRDFLDLFHHRTVSLFFRAWKKYRLPFQYEAPSDPRSLGKPLGTDDGVDLATLCLYSLVGLGTGGLRGRRAFDDRLSLFFSGTFARQPRPALELERVLSSQMAVPVRVRQFYGRWLTLGDNELSRLGGGGQSDGYNRLGENVVIGQRVRDVQNSFRLELGPMSYPQFRRFMPRGRHLKPLCEFTRSFVGPEFEFDVQVILSARQIPECRLDSSATDGPRLGWNTWLRSNEIDREAADAVFLLSDV